MLSFRYAYILKAIHAFDGWILLCSFLCVLSHLCFHNFPIRNVNESRCITVNNIFISS